MLWAAALVLPALASQAGVVITTLHSFTGTNDGANPEAALVQDSDGNFYGTTEYGGTNDAGTVFKISAIGALTILHSFTGTNDGANPVAGLVQGSDGNFYGTTEYGGTNDSGTVFKISADGALTSLYSFTGTNDGANPDACLVQGSDGNFYGTTVNGGNFGYALEGQPANLFPRVVSYGTVFKISTNGALTTLYAFGTVTNAPGYVVDGANPEAGLVRGSDGNFYGTTFAGGRYGAVSAPGITLYYIVSYGTVYKISTNGALTTLYSFGTNEGSFGVALDGSNPEAGLVQGSDGDFYGTTTEGGTNGAGGYGTVFKISTEGALTTLYEFGAIQNAFARPLNGAAPTAGLLQGSDGNFYGTTFYGGTNGVNVLGGDGTVFQMSTNGALTTLYHFGGSDGANPSGGLVQGSDGSFYGTTVGGGVDGFGTVFRMTIVPEFQTMTLTHNTLSLTWSTEAGGTYQLQYNSDLSSSNWTNLGIPFTATGANLSTTDSVTNAPQRFYRLVLSP
jgi:uncharacterized repeat protein (TIGR03803 family)